MGTMKQTNLEKVLSIALDTRKALLAEWDKKGAFLDRSSKFSNFTDFGVLPDAIGLTGLMLLFNAFCDEEETVNGEKVIDDETKEKLTSIVTECVTKIDARIESYGYNADPLVKHGSSDDKYLFGGEGYAYTDTATWILSLSTLVRFGIMYQDLNVDVAISDKINRLMASSLRILLDAQREDGAWAFRSSPKSPASLYYSYAVVSALSDFFYYVNGDIFNDVENFSGEGTMQDTEMLSYLTQALGRDALAAANLARDRFSYWLLVNCVPRLPKLAECRKLNANDDKSEEEICRQLGISLNRDGNSEIRYINLYYTFYIIDALIANETDRFYDALYSGEKRNGFTFSKLVADIKEAGGMTDSERNYFFDRNAKNASGQHRFWEEYVKQSIHTSRGVLAAAMRTGRSWWDSSKSELKLVWYEDNGEPVDLRSTNFPTDPALSPMSLRANMQFVYYITKRPDVAMDEVFELITDSRWTGESDVSKVHDLWDNMDYNLMITERSIEALVDFYDYVNKYERIDAPELPPQTQEAVGVTVAQRSDLDLYLEKLIDSRIDAALKQLPIPQATPEEKEARTTANPTNAVINALAGALTNDKTFSVTNDLTKDSVGQLDLIFDALMSHWLDREFFLFGIPMGDENDPELKTMSPEQVRGTKSKILDLKREIIKDIIEKRFMLSDFYQTIKEANTARLDSDSN